MLHAEQSGVQLVYLIRLLQKNIFLLIFFMKSEIVAQVDAETAAVGLPVTLGIHRSLPDRKFIVVAVEKIADTQRDGQFIL